MQVGTENWVSAEDSDLYTTLIRNLGLHLSCLGTKQYGQVAMLPSNTGYDDSQRRAMLLNLQNSSMQGGVSTTLALAASYRAWKWGFQNHYSSDKSSSAPSSEDA